MTAGTIAGRRHSLPLGAADAQRPPDIEYAAQVARPAGQLGFAAVLTSDAPTWPGRPGQAAIRPPPKTPSTAADDLVS